MRIEEVLARYELPAGGYRKKAKEADAIVNEAWATVVYTLEERALLKSTPPEIKKEMRTAARAVRMAIGNKRPGEILGQARLTQSFRQFYYVSTEITERLIADLDFLSLQIAAGHALKKRMLPVRGRLFEACTFLTQNISRLKAQNDELTRT